MQRVSRVASQRVSGLVAAFAAVVFSLGAGAQVKRPMTFEDLQAIKRIADPQVSPSGKWVMFSVTEVDLAANKKTTHLWTVSIDGKVAEKKITSGKAGESNGRFSPDGKQILFISANDGTSQIWLAPWDEDKGTIGEAHRFTNVTTEADGAIWSPDSKSIAFVSDVYPECEQTTFNDACNKAEEDAESQSSVKAMIFDHLLYRHWDKYLGAKRTHILLVSASDAKNIRDLTPTREIGDHVAPTFFLSAPTEYAFSPDSKEFAYVVNVDKDPSSSTNNDIYTLQLDDSNAHPVKITTSPGRDDAPAYSPDGKWLAFRSQARNGYESDRFRLMVYDRVSNKTGQLLKDMDKSIDEIAWAPDGAAIFFTAPSDGQEVIYSAGFVGLQSKGVNAAYTLDSEAEFSEIRSFRQACDASSAEQCSGIAAVSMTASRPAQIVVAKTGMVGHTFYNLAVVDIDPKTRKWKSVPPPEMNSDPLKFAALTHLNSDVLSRLHMRERESFDFPSTDGTKIQGFIIRPPNFDPAKKYPLKFLIHGGPQGAWGDAWSYRWNPELFAANGYVVVMINPRGSVGYGQKFVEAVSGDWGGKPYEDLMAGLDYAEKKFPFIDKTRECALGASYGGYMANWILTHTNRFACIVTHDGMYNPQSAYGSTEEMWFNEWEFRRQIKDASGNTHPDSQPAQPWKYAKLPANEDPFRKWSPMLNIANAKTPTLVVHGQKDYRLDVSEGFQLFTALQRLGVPSRMLYFPDEGHWVLKPQNSKLWYETVNDWCDRWTHTNKYAK